MGTSRIRSRLVPKDTAQKYGYKVLDWKEFVSSIQETGTSDVFTLSSSQGTSSSRASVTNVNSVYVTGLWIDADNTGLLEAIVPAYSLWQADLTQPIDLTVGFSVGNIASGNTFDFSTKYFALDPARATADGYATGRWTAVATDFGVVTAASSTAEDNNYKQMTGAIIPANALTAYSQCLAIQLTPAFGGSYADNTACFQHLILRYTRRMV